MLLRMFRGALLNKSNEIWVSKERKVKKFLMYIDDKIISKILYISNYIIKGLK